MKTNPNFIPRLLCAVPQPHRPNTEARASFFSLLCHRRDPPRSPSPPRCSSFLLRPSLLSSSFLHLPGRAPPLLLSCEREGRHWVATHSLVCRLAFLFVVRGHCLGTLFAATAFSTSSLVLLGAASLSVFVILYLSFSIFLCFLCYILMVQAMNLQQCIVTTSPKGAATEDKIQWSRH